MQETRLCGNAGECVYMRKSRKYIHTHIKLYDTKSPTTIEQPVLDLGATVFCLWILVPLVPDGSICRGTQKEQ